MDKKIVKALTKIHNRIEEKLPYFGESADNFIKEIQEDIFDILFSTEGTIEETTTKTKISPEELERVKTALRLHGFVYVVDDTGNYHPFKNGDKIVLIGYNDATRRFIGKSLSNGLESEIRDCDWKLPKDSILYVKLIEDVLDIGKKDEIFEFVGERGKRTFNVIKNYNRVGLLKLFGKYKANVQVGTNLIAEPTYLEIWRAQKNGFEF